MTYRTPAHGDTLVIVQGATVQALDVATGTLRWTFELNSANYKWGQARVCVSDSQAFVLAIAEEPMGFFSQNVTPEIISIHLQTGQVLARTRLPIALPLGNATNVTMLLNSGTLFVGIAAHVFALDAVNNGLRWAHRMPESRPTDEQAYTRMAMALPGQAVQPD